VQWRTREATIAAIAQRPEKIAMSDLLESRERLESAHKQLQDAMTELITKKNYSEAERLLLVVDKLMLDLIEDMGAPVVRPSVWT
jgi:hypothetical protein